MCGHCVTVKKIPEERREKTDEERGKVFLMNKEFEKQQLWPSHERKRDRVKWWMLLLQQQDPEYFSKQVWAGGTAW